jgi:hypothetical protein
MKVHELAKDLEVDSSRVIEILGDNRHHLAEVTEDEMEKVVEAVSQGGQEEEGSTAEPEEKIVRFWSDVMNHAFLVHGKLIKFAGYKLNAVVDSPVYDALVALRDPSIRLVQDTPFKDRKDRTMFREMLEAKLFAGPGREVSAHRGMGYLEALFLDSQQQEVALAMHESGPAGIVDLAVETKSYKPL